MKKTCCSGTIINWSSQVGKNQLIWYGYLRIEIENNRVVDTWQERQLSFLREGTDSYQLNFKPHGVCFLSKSWLDENGESCRKRIFSVRLPFLKRLLRVPDPIAARWLKVFRKQNSNDSPKFKLQVRLDS